MSNTRRATGTTPKAVVPADDDVELWDEFVKDATPDIDQWRKRMPDGHVLVVPCPSAAMVDALGIAQLAGDVQAMLTAIFRDDAEEIIELTKDQAFTIRVRLINDVMLHYGMSMSYLPESGASST